MKISYDNKADAFYITAKNAKIKRTKRVDRDILIDLDAKGAIRGIEILNASRWFLTNNKQPSIEIGSRKILVPALTN